MFCVEVPASTSNLGPGFDTLGLALELTNEVWVEPCEHGLTIKVEGEGAESLARDEKNLVVRAMRLAFAERRLPGLKLRQVNRIPLSRGLGSSAAAIVGGLVAAQQLLGQELPLLELANRMEGHPDNVAPVISGGLVASGVLEQGAVARQVPLHECWQLSVAVPPFPLSTEEARRALPPQVSFEDAVFNLSRLALLLSGLSQGLELDTGDRLHQPYRERLVPGFAAVCAAARQAGAAGAFLSGAGPTMAAFVDRRRADATEVARAMAAAFGEGARGWALEPRLVGARVR